MLVEDKMPLNGSGTDFCRERRNDLIGEFISEMWVFGVKVEEQFAGLVQVTAPTNVLIVIDATWSYERRIESFAMICSHEDDSFFCRSDTIEGIQKATKGQFAAAAGGALERNLRVG